MQYILSPKGGACIFCGLAGADAAEMGDKLVLVATDTAFVVLNRYPFNTGHLLVVPKRHVADLGALGEEESNALFRLVRAATARLTRAVGAQGANIGLNLGAAAGAGISDHLHVHIVPRWDGDTNFMPVVSDLRVMPEYLSETYARLLPHFSDVA
jgi:ATP adenylyltransferase